MTKPLPPELRKTGFWLNVRKLPGEDACWLWEGQLTDGGYGTCSFRGRTMMAHRAAWIMEEGAIPPGMLVLHTCDIRPCVRRKHLFLGTHQDNMDDMWRKGRGPSGKHNGSHTKPHRRAAGDRNGSRTAPESRERGADHWTRRMPERVARGARLPFTKLTDEQKTEIRAIYARNEATQAKLAKQFNVSQVHISRIVRGEPK